MSIDDAMKAYVQLMTRASPQSKSILGQRSGVLKATVLEEELTAII
jgi:hypothetical protein